MKELFGINVSAGYGIGPVYCYNPTEYIITRRKIDDTTNEKAKLEKALILSIEQLRKLYLDYAHNIDDTADIIESHITMIEDPDLKDSIVEKIEKGYNVEWAVDKTIKEYVDIFNNMDNDYFKERSLDIEDIGKRIINNIIGKTDKPLSKLKEKVILITKELTPSDTLSMDIDKILGIVTETGGKTSHTAILARTLGIPAVTGIDTITEIVSNQEHIIIDGTKGKIILEPEEFQINKYKQMIERRIIQLEEEKSFIGCKTKTRDGYNCKICCNMGSLDDVQQVLNNDGEGIGLFRTEFLYMNRQIPPSEEEQYDIYSNVGKKLKGKELIIRTLDVGGDKKIEYINIEDELNPFLGNRAIRYCLQEEKLLLTQLKGILRASKECNIKIMFPMITAYEEIIEAKKLLEKAKEKLIEEEKSFNENIKVGIMIETPAAVLNSAEFAREVDFFSIGTNDLTQYVCAVDRMNTKVSYLYSPYNPAVIKSIKMVVKNAHMEGIEVSICGETASDELLLPLWISLGIDELSVIPRNVLGIRKHINSISRNETLINEALKCKSRDEMIKFLKNKSGI
ncbi:phosphoenolpyruvate--protein phosphotransferase [Vallitalea sp.]|jgi:phosphotransferase system enzyme I (PtsI)|uniref:phosphoenolpyruvate--protein phosphotransferase n=1 Tax=Vallitalea sp. TaxID=1882829 RepID=UPI0025CDBAAC|nr:phosphoenolpyruvate--protein phosphotransferase [Vallitalea sp.]MCT4687984.1 phosphoenolpyruvate--protein phosphotransferase [Vallitalea sp.]